MENIKLTRKDGTVLEIGNCTISELLSLEGPIANPLPAPKITLADCHIAFESMVKNGQMIAAIKLYRLVTNSMLRESKDYIEHNYGHLRPRYPL